MTNISHQFDPSKISFVSINDIFLNDYNPKNENTKEYQQLKKSIQTVGLRGLLYVRHKELSDGKQTYETIDGSQKYKVCKELGYEELPIYDFGDMDLEKAKQLTLMYQVQIPFDKLKLADILKDLASQEKDYVLPYADEDVKKYLKMADSSWEDYKGVLLELTQTDDVVKIEVDQDFLKELKLWILTHEPTSVERKQKLLIVSTTKIKVLSDAMSVIAQAIEKCMRENNIEDKGRALELIAANFLS